jgi:hypothetical protein
VKSFLTALQNPVNDSGTHVDLGLFWAAQKSQPIDVCEVVNLAKINMGTF